MPPAQSLSWLSINILPCEGEARGWLRRKLSDRNDVDDVIQEAYCRLCTVERLDLIDNPRAYFFKVIRNVVIDQRRRARVVHIEAMSDLEALNTPSEESSPEHTAVAKANLRLVRTLIAALPERCRTIVEMRKLEGLSQQTIAARLNVSENIVENEAARGLKAVLKALEEMESAAYQQERLARREARDGRPEHQ